MNRIMLQYIRQNMPLVSVVLAPVQIPVLNIRFGRKFNGKQWDLPASLFTSTKSQLLKPLIGVQNCIQQEKERKVIVRTKTRMDMILAI